MCRILSLAVRLRRPPPAEARPERILVILLSEMGSLVLAYPMFRYLRERFPGVSLYALVFEQNREVLDLLQIVPREQISTISNETPRRFVGDTLRALGRLRKARLNVVIDCELFARVGSILSLFSGAPVRVGFHRYTQEGLYRGDFINRPVLYNPYHSIARQFLNLVDAISSGTTPTSKYPVADADLSPPAVVFSEAEITAMRARLDRDFPEIGGRTLVLLYPGGGVLPIRAWPLDHFVELARELLEKGYAVGLIGLTVDKPLAREILARCRHPDCIDLTGYTASIRELLVLFNLASLLVTNDGGPGQFAVMTNIPSIILYGPETPRLYAPLGNKAVLFHMPIACSPCLTAYNHRNSPCDGDNLCLKLIQPRQVLAKALALIEKDQGGDESAERVAEGLGR